MVLKRRSFKKEDDEALVEVMVDRTDEYIEEYRKMIMLSVANNLVFKQPPDERYYFTGTVLYGN